MPCRRVHKSMRLMQVVAQSSLVTTSSMLALPCTPHLEEQAKLHAPVVLQVVAVVQRLVHAEHAQREGLARHRRDVRRCRGQVPKICSV